MPYSSKNSFALSSVFNSFFTASSEYWADTVQRSILFWDVLRERGNNYIEHEEFGKPPVLVFNYEIILDARQFERAANYALAAIVPPAGSPPTDPAKRPFVVIDPRAGHGPGIGGFKMDSEVGIALRAGHPCYFVMFFPHPVAEQTIECVTNAEREFIKKVNERHPNAPGRPFVIGNCQGGWALMILAALNPESLGPILLAGTPLSYWAGMRGKNPLRYLGGLLGGTWSASFAGDLGNGKFDGTHLVNNFEALDPANTFWNKLYRLYTNVDTEREYFLEFERWWGGHFLLNKAEMEWITQNLFVGNHLSSGEITIDDERVDLRNIRSPIIVFASWGDNITSPQQALNWIPDLYENTEQIRDNEQTIIYFLHEKIGHLGIFVSAGVAEREHSEFVSAIDLIDVLPPGLYEAIIIDATPDMPGLSFGDDRYVIRFEPREVSDIVAMNDDQPDQSAFQLVRHVAELNQLTYDRFISPWVQLFSNDITASFYRNLQHSRLERLLISDSNPLIVALKPLAKSIRSQRVKVAEDNPWLQLEKQSSLVIEKAWDTYRDIRDSNYEALFNIIYGSTILARATGFDPSQKSKPHLPNDQIKKIRERRAEYEKCFENGSVETGFLRLLIFVAKGTGVVDERPFNGIKRLMKENGMDKRVSLQQLKDAIKQQTYLVKMDEQRALLGLTHLLSQKTDRQHALKLARELLLLGGAISEEKEGRLRRVQQIFDLA